MKHLKSLFFSLGFLAVLFASETSDAQDKDGYYFKGELGYGFSNDTEQFNGTGIASTNESNDDIVKLGIGLGYNPEGPMRTELSFSYSPNMESSANSTNATTTNSSIDNYLLMVNAYYDFDEVSQSFVPYIGGGVGISRMVQDDTSIKNASGSINLTEGGVTKNNLGWALGLGTAIQVEGDVSLDIGYRYLALGESEGNGVFSGSPAQTPNSGGRIGNQFIHELYLGVRIGF
jgi:opacity protein-like surface antigen